MEFKNNRVQDITKVFDRNWNVNHDREGRQSLVDSRKQHFEKMYNIKSKENHRQEMLRANSVDGQVKNLNDRMNSMVGNQNRMRVSEFKNNFR